MYLQTQLNFTPTMNEGIARSWQWLRSDLGWAVSYTKWDWLCSCIPQFPLNKVDLWVPVRNILSHDGGMRPTVSVDSWQNKRLTNSCFASLVHEERCYWGALSKRSLRYCLLKCALCQRNRACQRLFRWPIRQLASKFIIQSVVNGTLWAKTYYTFSN